MDEPSEIKTRLRRQGFQVALVHLENAESALQRGEWESSNGQVRSFVEDLFNRVAFIRLKSSKSGGSARKLLESEGVLAEPEARLVQKFMRVSGQSGSHAGSSTADEAQGRFLVGLGIGYLGLSLVPELVRVEDVLKDNLTPPSGSELPRDSDIKTECPTCGLRQSLGEADIRREEEDTIYYCASGCQPVVVVSQPEDPSWPGRGYRLGNKVIRNTRDIRFSAGNNGNEVLMPASPAALRRKK